MNTLLRPITGSALASGLTLIALVYGACLLNTISITQPALF